MESLVVEQTPAIVPQAVRDNGPLPMSFPAILRNPGLSDRFAHLRVRTQSSATSSPAAVKRNRRDEKEGKRWVRRKENGTYRFVRPVALMRMYDSPFCRQRAHRCAI